MAQNVIDLLERLLCSNEVLSRIGALIGLSPEKTKAGIGAAVPAILAGLVGLVQKPEGWNQLAGVVRDQDTGLLDNLTAALGGGRDKAVIASGQDMLSSLFGQGQVDALTGAIGRSTGLDRSSVGSLLGILAPVVMGVLGREQRSRNLTAQGLARMLTDQKDDIADALPARLASALGSTKLLEGVADRLGEGVSRSAQAGRATAAEAVAAGATAADVAGSAARAPQRGGSTLRWLVGLAAVLAVLWAGYHLLSRDQELQGSADRAADTPAAVGAVASSLTVGDVDVGQQITGVFEGATAALDRVTDAASAEAALPTLTELNASLTQLGGLVDQLPAEGKSALASLVSGALASLEALIAKVSEIPGAADVIKPAADPMLERLRAMTA